jgi:hypothetical protein
MCEENDDRHLPGYESVCLEVVRRLVQDVGMLRRLGVFRGTRLVKAVPGKSCLITMPEAAKLSVLLNSRKKMAEMFAHLGMSVDVDWFLRELDKTEDYNGQNMGRLAR